MAGWGFGVQLTSDHAQGTTVEYNGLNTYDSSGNLHINPTGITFPDATVQTTAGYPNTNPSGFLTDAPSDGFSYNRKNGAWDVAGSGGSVAWGAITGTVTDQTDLVTYVTGLGYQTAGDVSTYVTGLGYQTAGDVSTYVSSVGRRQSIVESVRSVCNDAGIGYDGGGYLFIPLNSGCLNNPVSISQFSSGSKWFGMWDNVGLSSVVAATSVTLSSGVVTITFGTTSPFVAGYGLFYTEDGGTTWVQSTFHLA
jgi:hypothetical protein